MVRSAAAVLVLGLGCAGLAQDKDPIREKLAAAQKAYEGDLQQFHKGVDEWFGKREGAARAAGDKKQVDQIKGERKSFEEGGELPKGAPAALVQKPAVAKKVMEGAFAEAHRAYARSNRDDEAALVEEQWHAFHTKPVSNRPGPIDLLALVDTKTHVVHGEWKRDGGTVVGASDNRQARLQLPYEPGEEYDFEATFRRVKGADGFCLGLVAGGRQVLAVVDGWPNENGWTGFDTVDGRNAANNSTRVNGLRLSPNRDNTVTCRVRAGQIDLVVNGKPATSFKGEFSRLGLWQDYRVSNEKVLFLFFGPGASFQVSRVVVTPVRGKGTVIK